MYISVLMLVLEVKITEIDAIWNDLSQHLQLHSSFEGLSNYLLIVILVIFFSNMYTICAWSVSWKLLSSSERWKLSTYYVRGTWVNSTGLIFGCSQIELGINFLLNLVGTSNFKAINFIKKRQNYCNIRFSQKDIFSKVGWDKSQL